MRVALDYDNTYSLDPEFWQAFIALAKKAGHDVRMVTARDDRYDRTEPLVEAEGILPVYYTRGVAKRFFCTHLNDDGWLPQIWVDDKPESIIANSATSAEALAEWRETRGEAAACA